MFLFLVKKIVIILGEICLYFFGKKIVLFLVKKGYIFSKAMAILLTKNSYILVKMVLFLV